MGTVFVCIVSSSVVLIPMMTNLADYKYNEGHGRKITHLLPNQSPEDECKVINDIYQRETKKGE